MMLKEIRLRSGPTPENEREGRTYDQRNRKDLEELYALPYDWEVISRSIPHHGDGVEEVIQGLCKTKKLAKAYALGFVDMLLELWPEKIKESGPVIDATFTERVDWPEFRYQIIANDGSCWSIDVRRKRVLPPPPAQDRAMVDGKEADDENDTVSEKRLVIRGMAK
jgi:hypothetical protein